MRKRGPIFLGLITATAMLWPGMGIAAPARSPDGALEIFAHSDPDSTAVLNHASWADVLRTVVKDGTRGRRDVAYGHLNAIGVDVLRQYLATMQSIKVTDLNRHEQLAYWLNLYNAAAFDVMLEQFLKIGGRATDSVGPNPYRERTVRVKKIYQGKDSPWNDPRLTVEGVRLSLSDIEHRILYAYWDPTLVMYGLACPARSCPALQPVPYQGAIVEQQLHAAAQEFVARRDSVHVHGSKVDVSELYQWHQNDLGGDQGIIAHIRSLAGPALKAKLANVTRIGDYEFSWQLNGKPPIDKFKGTPGTINRGAGPSPQF